MKNTYRGILGAIIYTVILILVMLVWNHFDPDNNFEGETISAATAAFIAYCAGFRSGVSSEKSESE